MISTEMDTLKIKTVYVTYRSRVMVSWSAKRRCGVVGKLIRSIVVI